MLQNLQFIGVIIGAGLAALAVLKYWSESRHRETERLFNLRQRYWKLMSTPVGESGELVMDLLEGNDAAQISLACRQQVLGFFKEAGILVQHGAVNKRDAFYLLAYFAIRCEENSSFWEGLNKDSIYWNPFFEFVEEMRKIEKTTSIVAHSASVGG